VILAEWWDIRDLGNLVSAIVEWLDGKIPGGLIYALQGIIGAIGVLSFVGAMAIVMVWVERRVIGRMQVRVGPNRVGPLGLLQPVADAIKLIQKEVLIPRRGDKVLFLIAPVAIFVPTILSFGVLPFAPGMIVADLNVGVLFFLAVGSTATLSVWMAGWASNNKYSLLGAMRAVAMMISYEVPLVLSILSVVILTGSMQLGEIVAWQQERHILNVALLPLMAFFLLFAATAELGRTPTDISEAESELGAGYHTEYSGMKFGLFYAMELAHTLAVSGLIATLFLGGWWMYGIDQVVPPWMIFIGKLLAVDFIFIWLRGTLPRFRIDQLMTFAWKFMLPLSLVMILGVAFEVLVWMETPLRDEFAIPLFIVINGSVSLLLVPIWVKVVGYRPAKLPRRARLVREISGVPVTQ
jgi:NADH-quinone oxidoreductase subunit H